LIEKQGDTLDEAGQKGGGAEEQEAALATINGQKDVLTLSSSILQVMRMPFLDFGKSLLWDYLVFKFASGSQVRVEITGTRNFGLPAH
jgi:hypothetical protein